MPVSAQESVTARMLQQHTERGATARLLVGAGAAEIAVYLLDGQIVAVAAPGDTRQLIDRLAQSRRLPADRAEHLRAMLDDSPSDGASAGRRPILDLLSQEVAPEVFEEVMRQRFDENLSRFIGHRGTPLVEEGAAPWADNVLIGEPTTTLIARCSAAWALATALDESEALTGGPSPATSPFSRLALQAVHRAPMTAGDLANAFDLEPIAARAVVQELRRRGVLARAEAASAGPPSPPVRAETAFTTSLGDDELDAFSGELDRNRGGATRSGTFVARSHHLDRVEIVDLGASSSEEDRAQRNREGAYSAPSLTEADALAKIEVANDVTTALAKAVDLERGAPRGAAMIQLLVDGRPRPYVPLFDNVRVSSAGALPARALLDNLRKRPSTEQRRLLNQGLLDLLDRALDKAANEISEKRFDTLLEALMGYRQRMGL